jgi:imidazole glycerol-phosphate synthase subunit HisH|tara:strand:- start:275 stop:898 length:624 start_codon:yes stop_codon:yes gene_type:complete
MLGLVNYGSGNYQSVCNALDFLLIDYLEIKTAQDMANVSHIILPGVGAFNDCMKRLDDTHLLQDLKREVLENKKLFLGICVGHQILMSLGTEFEEKEGLGWIEGTTKKLVTKDHLPVPHIGWTEVHYEGDNVLFKNIDTGSTFYFVHSYYVEVKNSEDILATAQYGHDFVVAIQRENIFGVQFHPEKSQENGLQILKNFSEIKGSIV